MRIISAIYNPLFINKPPSLVRTIFLWMGGRWFLGFHPKIFELKGGPSQKIEGEGGHAGICTGLREALKEKLGDHAKIFRDN